MFPRNTVFKLSCPRQRDIRTGITKPIYALSYQSSPESTFFRNDPLGRLRDILMVSRERNEAHNVTSALMCSAGKFLQVLEGPKRAVEETFARIRKDGRHTGVILLSKQSVSQRYFEGSPMIIAGLSLEAREYYRYFTNYAGFDWQKLDNNCLCALMLKLIELDEMSACAPASRARLFRLPATSLATRH